MATPEPNTFIRRSLAILAALALLTGMMAVSASRPSPVDATFGYFLSKFRITTIANQTAGTEFTITVEALDYWGFRVWGYNGANLELSGLADSPNGTEPSYGTPGTWSNGVGKIKVTAYAATASATITVKDTARNVSKTSNAFAVAPGPIGLSFTAQPRDAEVGTAIRSSYAAGDQPVTVLAADAWGNPGAGLSVGMSTSTALGGTTTRTTASNGVASFNDLSIGTTGTYQLTATSGSATATSVPFQIVLDLAVCSGDSCTGQATVGGRTDRQTTFSSVETNELFDDVALTTSFIGDNSAAQCLGSSGIFGQVTDVRVVGDGISDAEPSFLVALIVPKATLQALSLTARNAESFDVCLGALRLDGGNTGWTGKATVDDSDPATSLGTDGAWWGWVADCGTVGADDPCVKVKTKNAGQLASALGMSSSSPEFKALGFSSSDLGIVVQKTWPWDGKMGMK
jgi:hypothetical protein